VNAEEQHHRHAVGGLALDPGQGPEALAGEALGHEGQEGGHLGVAGELVVAVLRNSSMVALLKVPPNSLARRVAAQLEDESLLGGMAVSDTVSPLAQVDMWLTAPRVGAWEGWAVGVMQTTDASSGAEWGMTTSEATEAMAE